MIGWVGGHGPKSVGRLPHMNYFWGLHKGATWGNFNQNSDSLVNTTNIFNIHGTGSDGSTFTVNQLEHSNQRPDGSVNEFFHCH